MRVRKLMTEKVEACRPSDSIKRAVEIMRRQDCGSVPVIDGQRRVVGIITDRDIVLAAAMKSIPELKVSDYMADDVECATPKEKVLEAEKKLRTRRVRRLPVVDKKQRLVGMLSIADLARATDKKKLRKADVGRTIVSISRAAGKKR